VPGLQIEQRHGQARELITYVHPQGSQRATPQHIRRYRVEDKVQFFSQVRRHTLTGQQALKREYRWRDGRHPLQHVGQQGADRKRVVHEAGRQHDVPYPRRVPVREHDRQRSGEGLGHQHDIRMAPYCGLERIGQRGIAVEMVAVVRPGLDLDRIAKCLNQRRIQTTGAIQPRQQAQARAVARRSHHTSSSGTWYFGSA